MAKFLVLARSSSADLSGFSQKFTPFPDEIPSTKAGSLWEGVQDKSKNSHMSPQKDTVH